MLLRSTENETLNTDAQEVEIRARTLKCRVLLLENYCLFRSLLQLLADIAYVDSAGRSAMSSRLRCLKIQVGKGIVRIME